MIGFEVLPCGRYGPEKVAIIHRQDRTVHWKDQAEAHICRVWADYQETTRFGGFKVYNGSLLRLDSVVHENGTLLLEVSDVDFRSYVGTASPGFADAFPAEPQANPLAVCVALSTSDGKIVIERRKHVDPYRGRYHVIGGFLERGMDTANGRPDAFRAMKREVLEELGVTIPAGLVATGLVRTSVGSELCFSCRLDHTFDDILKIKTQGKTDAEIDELLALPDRPNRVLAFLEEHLDEIVPSGRACLLLHGLHNYDEEWYGAAVKRFSG
jgi:8-oxo-dGTP pyrophosphatase MutT (NUDIX family)